MKRTRVEIGSLVLRGSGHPAADGASFGRIVQAHLEQLLRGRAARIAPRSADVVRVHGSAAGRDAYDARARAIAHAVYRSLQGKV